MNERTHHNLGPAVDELGRVEAEIAKLRERQAALKAELVEASGAEPSAFEGEIFRTTVSFPADSDVVDWRTVAEKAGASRQLIRAHTKTKKNSPRVCTKARSTEPKKVA